MGAFIGAPASVLLEECVTVLQCGHLDIEPWSDRAHPRLADQCHSLILVFHDLHDDLTLRS